MTAITPQNHGFGGSVAVYECGQPPETRRLILASGHDPKTVTAERYGRQLPFVPSQGDRDYGGQLLFLSCLNGLILVMISNKGSHVPQARCSVSTAGCDPAFIKAESHASHRSL